MGVFPLFQPSWLVMSKTVDLRSSARDGHVIPLDLWTGVGIHIQQASPSNTPPVATLRRLGPRPRGSQQGRIHQSRWRGHSEHLPTAENQVGLVLK